MQTPHAMSHAAPLVTAEELERMPEDDYRYELVEGRLIRMSPAAPLHGSLAANFIMLLGPHVRAHNLGAVGTEVGFKLVSNPDTVRAPDVSLIRRERFPSTGFRRGFWQGPPDLAVEVLSPDDVYTDTRRKIDEYLRTGCLAVVVLDPDDQTVTIHRRLSVPAILTIDDTLDLDDVVPGFSCPVREIFQPWI